MLQQQLRKLQISKKQRQTYCAVFLVSGQDTLSDISFSYRRSRKETEAKALNREQNRQIRLLNLGVRAMQQAVLQAKGY